MKKSSLFALTTMVLLLIAVFVPVAFSTGPTQPPVDTSTLYVGTIAWGPRRADPVRAYDTGSGELLFNVYDTLISMGSPVTYGLKTFDVEEQYWAFEPSLATNVPERQEVIQEEIQVDPFEWEIVIRNQEPIPPPPLTEPICTWWEDAIILPQPYNGYHLADWVDSNQNGELDFCDFIQLNAYWWPEKIVDKECEWWHVEQIEYNQVYYLLHLTWVPNPKNPPVFPECTWWTITGHPDQLYHINGWVDNNPDGEFGTCDVIYKKKHDVVPVVWEKIGPGFHLLPVTKRTYHVLEVLPGPPMVIMDHYFYYDFYIRTDPVIYFYDSAGVAVDTFDIYDAEYSLKRGLVQDQYGSPMWMYYKPLFDQMNSDYWDTDDLADPIELSWLIHDAVEIVSLDPPVLRINVGIAFPDAGFKQIMAQTWGSILSKSWCIGKGCWNGDLFLDTDQDCYPDWFESPVTHPGIGWRHVSLSPIQAISTANYAGTGPYRVVVASAAQYSPKITS